MDNPMVLLETTAGEILLELFPDKAPLTVENFLRYVDEGFYAGTIFHRVIPDFMIQGGGLDWQLKEKPTRGPIQNEAASGLKNEAFTVAMARTSEPHSAKAQFFINVVDNPSLDHTDETPEGYGYAVFGQVAEGREVVEKIRKARTKRNGAHESAPIDSVDILSASRFEL